jgi:hypothetical protein
LSVPEILARFIPEILARLRIFRRAKQPLYTGVAGRRRRGDVGDAKATRDQQERYQRQQKIASADLLAQRRYPESVNPLR